MDATQQKGSPKQLRGRSLGTKLSEAEYAQCEKSAARRGRRNAHFVGSPSQRGGVVVLAAVSRVLCKRLSVG